MIDIVSFITAWMFRRLPLFVLFIITGSLVAQQSIILHERLGVSRSQEPVTFGIPFSKGELSDPALLGLYQDQSNVPAEVETLSLWNDGSVRWARVHAQMDASANSKTSDYNYKIGSTHTPQGDLTVQETADEIVINTGALRFAVSKTNFNLFNSVDLDLNDDGVYQNSERVVDPDLQSGAAVTYNGQEFLSSFLPPETIRLEKSGPLSAVIYVSGIHGSSNGSYLKYETRIYAYSGKSYVRVSHSYSSRTTISGPVQGLSDPSLQVPIDDYSLRLQSNIAGDKKVLFGGDEGAIHRESVASGGSVMLTQNDKIALSDPFLYGIDNNGLSSVQGERAEGWAIAVGDRFAVGIGSEYFWERMPGAIDFEDDGSLSIHPIMNKSLHVSMGSADEYIFWFMKAEDADSNQDELRAMIRGRLIAQVEPSQIETTKAFYDLNDCYESEWPNMKAYIDLTSASHISTRDELGLYGDLNFGDVPRSFFETDETNNMYNVWGNNYYDCAITAGRLFALHGNTDYFDILEPMTRHWMETDCWNAEDGNPYHGYVPSYSIVHRENPNFNHHYGEGIWYYFYLTGDERARQIGVRAATTIDEQQFWGNEFSTIRGAALRGAACLEAYKATGNVDFLNRARSLIDIIMDTQNQYGMIGNIFQSVSTGQAEVGGSQTFMMGLFADLVWKYLQEVDDEELKNKLVLLADFVNDYARIPNESENYYNFWGSPEQVGVPQPEFEGSLDDYVYWNSKGLIAGLYAYAYYFSQDEKYKIYAKNLLDHIWGAGYQDRFGDEFWGKASSQAMKNALHAASIVCGSEEITTPVSHIDITTDCIEIFPNPTDQYFNITGDLSGYNIDVIDITGSVVQSAPSSGDLMTIDISMLGVGIYFVRVINTANNQLHIEQMIKQ